MDIFCSLILLERYSRGSHLEWGKAEPGGQASWSVQGTGRKLCMCLGKLCSVHECEELRMEGRAPVLLGGIAGLQNSYRVNYRCSWLSPVPTSRRLYFLLCWAEAECSGMLHGLSTFAKQSTCLVIWKGLRGQHFGVKKCHICIWRMQIWENLKIFCKSLVLIAVAISVLLGARLLWQTGDNAAVWKGQFQPLFLKSHHPWVLVRISLWSGQSLLKSSGAPVLYTQCPPPVLLAPPFGTWGLCGRGVQMVFWKASGQPLLLVFG